MTPDGDYALNTLAVLVLDAGDDVYFEPQAWEGDLDAFFEYTRQKALYLQEDTVEALEKAIMEDGEEGMQLLILSTCSSEFSNARTLVLTWMRKK